MEREAGGLGARTTSEGEKQTAQALELILPCQLLPARLVFEGRSWPHVSLANRALFACSPAAGTCAPLANCFRRQIPHPKGRVREPGMAPREEQKALIRAQFRTPLAPLAESSGCFSASNPSKVTAHVQPRGSKPGGSKHTTAVQGPVSLAPSLSAA